MARGSAAFGLRVAHGFLAMTAANGHESIAKVTRASYCNVTLVMALGEQISGCALVAAVDALQAKLNDMTPPPMAA